MTEDQLKRAIYERWCAGKTVLEIAREFNTGEIVVCGVIAEHEG